MPEPEKREFSVIRESSTIKEVKKDRSTSVFLTIILLMFLFIFLLFLFKKALLPGLNLLIMPLLLFGGIAVKLLVIKGVYLSDSSAYRMTLLQGRLRVRDKGGKRLFFIEDTPVTLPAEWGRAEFLNGLDGLNVKGEVTLNDEEVLLERIEAEKGRAVED